MPGKSAGRLMLIGFWISVLALLAVMFEGQEQRRANPNLHPASTTDASGEITVTLQRNRKGHYVAGGSINRHKVTFLLDTGATDVVVPGALAKRIGLQAESRGYAVTAAGTVPVSRTVLDSVQIGGIELYRVQATINPHMEGDGVLLGMSALRQVEFTQRGNQLTLRYLPAIP